MWPQGRAAGLCRQVVKDRVVRRVRAWDSGSKMGKPEGVRLNPLKGL